MPKNVPDARLEDGGRVVCVLTGDELPNYAGLVYALLAGRPYVLWLFPTEPRTWAVVNAGSTVVDSELTKFIKENSSE